MVGRGLHEIVGWSFTEPALLDRLRLPAEHPLRRVVDAREPALGGPVDHAPDAARLAARRRPPQRLAQRRRHRDLRVRHRLPRAPSGTRADAPRTPADEHHALGALLSGALAPRSWRGERARGRLLRRQGAARRRCSTASTSTGRVRGRARRWPFLHPGRSAAVLAPARTASRPLGFLGEVHPLVAARLGPDAHGRVRDRPRQARRARPAGRRASGRSAPSRRCARTSR